ncbi:MAG: isoleucine--tRNA ligase [Mariprofundaceae bacterium]|nr:isoleucine--tRNA ligase [Mariprofundaceae bacterium]
MSDQEKFDYRPTIFLPKTDFPMRGKLPQAEPKWLKKWEEEGLYEALREKRKDAPKYIVHDGPPYANGNIHIGHAVNKVLKDLVVRSRSMMGFNAPYVPGWDCHGLPIELKVEEKFAKKKRKKADISSDEFRTACRDYAADWLNIQREEFKRLGVMGDWDHPYVTMDYAYEANTVREIGKFLDSGHLRRGAKPVHWCVKDQTALAEAEVEHEEHVSHSIHVKFSAAQDLSDVDASLRGKVSVVIWTTTPWTIPANKAVTLGPNLEYSAVKIGTNHENANLEAGEILILATDLVESVMHALQVDDFQVLSCFAAKSLENKVFRHPYLEQDAPILLGDHVTLDAGTGCVHTAPGHGQEDYDISLAYGIEAFNPVDHAGIFVPQTPVVGGTHVFKANAAMVEHLQETGSLLANSKVKHSYPHCWRCHTPLIFRATPQWFIGMAHDGLRDKALAEVKKTRWVPAWGEKRINSMVESRPDWCVSRQRNWGVPITVIACKSCSSHAVTTPEVIERIALKVAEKGADVWFSEDVSSFLAENASCPDCGDKSFTKETDILDVWFDSGVSHACVLEPREDLQAPADLYLEGSDQHRGWFQSSLLVGVGTRGKAPFKTVLTHGFVVDAKGNKMSKSRGNVVAPQKLIEQMGADILRLWVTAEDYSDDIRISDNIVRQLSESYRRIRNTIRFLLSNLNDYDAAQDGVAVEDRSELDRWAMYRLALLQTQVAEDFEAFRFHRIHQNIHRFCSVDLGGFYLDVIKDRLYCDQANSVRRRSARASLHQIADTLIRLIAPILPFTAEEAWAHLPASVDESIHLQTFDEVLEVGIHHEAWAHFESLREQVNSALDVAKKDKHIGSALEADITIPKESYDLLAVLGEPLEQLLIVASVASGTEVTVAHSTGNKCPRCWNIGHAAHPEHAVHSELCGRCFSVIA